MSVCAILSRVSNILSIEIIQRIFDSSWAFSPPCIHDWSRLFSAWLQLKWFIVTLLMISISSVQPFTWWVVASLITCLSFNSSSGLKLFSLRVWYSLIRDSIVYPSQLSNSFTFLISNMLFLLNLVLLFPLLFNLISFLSLP